MNASLPQRSTYHLHPTGAPDRNLTFAESASRPSKSLSHASALLSASESITDTTSVETVSSLHRPELSRRSHDHRAAGQAPAARVEQQRDRAGGHSTPMTSALGRHRSEATKLRSWWP